MTREAGVCNSRLGVNSSAKDPQNRPHNMLGALSGGPVPKGQTCIEIVVKTPVDSEEHGLARVHPEPSVPPAIVGLKHGKLLAGVFSAIFFDERHDGFSCGEEDLPVLPPMFMRRNEPVNAKTELATIRDCPADWNLRGCAKRTSVNFKRNLAFLNPIHGACFYTLIMAHVVLKATSVSLGQSGIPFDICTFLPVM